MSAVSVEIPDEVSQGLDELAQSARMSREEFMLDLLLERLSDRELVRIADERMAEHLAGGSKSYSLEEVERELGLVD
jgi:RHH-type rel operon transcriptional repressor/antitoxin RelB